SIRLPSVMLSAAKHPSPVCHADLSLDKPGPELDAWRAACGAGGYGDHTRTPHAAGLPAGVVPGAPAASRRAVRAERRGPDRGRAADRRPVEPGAGLSAAVAECLGRVVGWEPGGRARPGPGRGRAGRPGAERAGGVGPGRDGLAAAGGEDQRRADLRPPA